MTWLFIIIVALGIAWLASSAVRRQKEFDKKAVETGRFTRGFTAVKEKISRKNV